MSGSSNAPAVRVVGVDHVVINCADVERSIDWYCNTLGLEPVRLEAWRRKEVLFPSVRVNESTIIDLLATERTGVNFDHVCVVIEPTDLGALAASGRFDVVGGPARLFGARGEGFGLYVRDPDGNTVELRYYDQ